LTKNNSTTKNEIHISDHKCFDGSIGFWTIKIALDNATSKSVSVKDDIFFDKNYWTLTPEAKPDVYTADRTRKSKWVVFYTDVDSIKTLVEPGSSFDFIILLNGKDSCYTRIESAISPESNTEFTKNTHDTIPFILTTKNSIHVKAIINETDTLNLHFDTGSFDFRLTQDAILKKTKLLANQPDALSGITKPNYNNLAKVYKIQIGKMVWENPVIVSTFLTATDMDGRFGGNIFEGKFVEIDYDKSIIVVHTEIPKELNEYTKLKLEFLRSFVCINGVLNIKNKKYEGIFLFDTGSDLAMVIDSNWAAKNNFPKDLEILKTSSFKNPRGVVFETKIVLCTGLALGSFELQNIPTTLLGSNSPMDFEVNFLGNDVLKRFNTILDFKNDYIYLKPNMMIDMPFKIAS
jgi:hypothetical protein